MIRLVVVVLFVSRLCLGVAFAGAPADSSSSAPQTTPAEPARPKAPANDAAKERPRPAASALATGRCSVPKPRTRRSPTPARSSSF
jgi:hypothetical protein